MIESSSRAQQNARTSFGRVTQDPEEFAALIDLVYDLRPKVVLEIGVQYGGSLEAWGRAAADDALLVGVDMAPHIARVIVGAAQRVVLIGGDSATPETRMRVARALGGRPVDFLFVDGGHDERTCRSDLETYAPLVRKGGRIAMHDVVGNSAVARVWEEWGPPREGVVFFNDGQVHRMGIGTFLWG